MKQDFENWDKEKELFHQLFDSFIGNAIPVFSPQSLEQFTKKPVIFQKIFLRECAEQQVEAFVPLAKQLVGQKENMAEVIIDSLTVDGNEISALILSRLAEEIDEKRIKKRFKKALYNLRVKGVLCPDLKEHNKPVFRKISLPKPEAFASNIDSAGDRLLILALPESLQFTMIFSFVLNDQVGIRELQEAFIKKKDLISYLKKDNPQTPITIVDVDYYYAQYLLHCAYQHNQKNGIPLPSHFTTRHKTLFDTAHDAESPLIYRMLNKETIEHNSMLLDHSSDLLKTPEIQNWLVDEKSVVEYRYTIDDVKKSSLIVSKAAQEERIESLIGDATRDFFTAERCELYKRRLEETAYIFLKTNRQREAEVSLAVAHSLTSDTNHVENQLFPRELIRRSLFSQKDERKDSSIIIPDSRLIV